MLYFLLGIFFGSSLLLAFYLTARSEHAKQEILTSQVIKEKRVILDFLHSMFESIAQGLSANDIYKQIVHGGLTTIEGVSACFFKFNSDTKELVACASEGLFPLLKTKLPKKLERSKMLSLAMHGECFDYGESFIGGVARDLTPISLYGKDLVNLPKNNDPALKIRALLIYPITFRKELFGVLAIANSLNPNGFSEERCRLFESVCEQVGIVLNSVRQLSELLKKRKLDFDLSLAEQVQSVLLPKTEELAIKGLELSVNYNASQKVGGDLYDIIPLDEYRTAIVIGDVSGKGVSASLLMATCLTHLKHYVHTDATPSSILKKLNTALYQHIPKNMFITMIYAIVDTQKNCIEFARAGHEYPFLIYNDQLVQLESPGMALGMMPEAIFNQVINDEVHPFDVNDVCLFYTDGLSEADNRDDVEFSSNNVGKFLIHYKNESPQAINENIIREVHTFRQKQSLKDDLTLITLKRINN